MEIRKNQIRLSENCSLRCGEDCNIQNNLMHVCGSENCIEIGNNVEFLGNGQNTSVWISGNNNFVKIEDNCKLLNVQFFVQGASCIIQI